MWWSIRSFLVLKITLTLLILRLSGQEIPHIQCPKFFQYLRNGNTVFGKISLFNLNLGSIKLDLQFSQQEIQASEPYKGSLKLFEDQSTTEKKLTNGEPIFFRVNFPIANKPPQLIEIKVNEEIICSSKAYSGANSKWSLQYNFNPSTVQRNTDCGTEAHITVPFIVGGYELKRGQFPWLTAIYEKQSGGLKFICGGSLISARSILSAAHCFNHTYTLPAERVLVYLGRNNLDNYSEDGIEYRDIETLSIHPDYNINRLSDADIALLRMKVSVSFSRYIKPICLWEDSNDINSIIGQKGYIGGWGKSKDSSSVSSQSKVVDAKVVSETECRRSSDTFSSLISSRTFCAGNRDKSGPCLGDSGSGFMILRNGRWTLRGIVSAGQIRHQQCDLEEFVIYCDVSKHNSWVKNNM